MPSLLQAQGSPLMVKNMKNTISQTLQNNRYLPPGAYLTLSKVGSRLEKIAYLCTRILKQHNNEKN